MNPLLQNVLPVVERRSRNIFRWWAVSGLVLWMVCGWAQAQVTAPVFNPTSAMAATELAVVVSCTATTHYTTNGQTPTQNDPTVANGGSVLILTKTTLKAKAWSGTNSSAVTSADYLVTGMVAAGTFHSVAMTFDGKVYAWGDQTLGVRERGRERGKGSAI